MDIERYKKELLNSSNTFDDISNFLNPYLPKKLYKYGNFNTKYWESLIFKGQAYLAKASNFNDPFDCLSYFDIEKVIKSPKIKEVMISRFPYLNNSSFKSDKNTYKNIVNGLQSDIRVTCFSEVWNSILMWSHYADCHKGFCIEYNTESLSNLKKRRLYAVLYQDNQIDITNDILNLTFNAGLISMVGKASEWSYEKEWRMIYQDSFTHEYLYFRREINSIILGIKCEEDNKNKVCEWASKNSIRVYRAKISTGKYEITKERLI